MTNKKVVRERVVKRITFPRIIWERFEKVCRIEGAYEEELIRELVREYVHEKKALIDNWILERVRVGEVETGEGVSKSSEEGGENE